MKSKRLMSVIMSLSLAFGIALPTMNVKAEPIVPTTKYAVSYSAYHAAPANEEKIIELLKKKGVITNDSTPEEIQEALREYLSKNDPAAQYKLGKQGNELREKMINKVQAVGVVEDKNYDMSKAKFGPSYVQPENFEGTTKVARPLVVLMQFPNYKFADITPEETDMYFANYDEKHYTDMLFTDGTFKGPNGEDLITMKQYYYEQSGGSYTVDGGIAGIYTSKNDAAYYGAPYVTSDGKEENDIRPRDFIKEAFDKVAADASIDLSKYDIEDRYDIDGDGNYNEPDGVVDHFIVVHAGVGQEAGGGNLGDDAIWAHRWNLGGNYTLTDTQGRTFSVNDYTMQPQDGAVGVFSHEYGHDLGLPDEYDTEYTGLGDTVGNWSIMSGGSWAGKVGGTEPVGFSPYAKEFLQANMGGNWLKGKTIDIEAIPAEGIDYLLDQASTKGTNNDVVRINLPDKLEKIVDPVSGANVYFSGSDNNLDNRMTMSLDLTGNTAAALNFKTWYQIEEAWDFASVEVKEEGLTEWKSLANDITTTERHPQAEVIVENGITGHSDGWIDTSFDLSAYAGKKIELRFRYQTDGAAKEAGFYVDDINIVADGNTIYTDDAEGTTNFSFDGFGKNDGNRRTGHYYLLEWRNHQGVDEGLASVQRGKIQYDPGLVMWYVNEGYDDNWVGVHPGGGFLGVVDADQGYDYMRDESGNPKKYASTTYMVHDAAFGLRRSSELNITSSGLSYVDDNTFMHPYFDDNRPYIIDKAGLNQYGLNLDKYGLKVYVTGESKDRSVAKIHIAVEK